ncbi:hypothetical protein WA026_019038 [Henosepilachna vigintioctopunctata]|uniref:Uncharacterized protein n=1 Tax=Henosepilachna vigintioctopunctata TaxID=420089 RepID=A0AAW1VGM8_9CUCU
MLLQVFPEQLKYTPEPFRPAFMQPHMLQQFPLHLHKINFIRLGGVGGLEVWIEKKYLAAAQVERRIRNKNKTVAAENKQKAARQIINTETGRLRNKTYEGIPSAQTFNEYYLGAGTNISKQRADTSTSFMDFLKKFDIKDEKSLFVKPAIEEDAIKTNYGRI